MCEKECGKIKNEEIEKEIKVIINGEIKSKTIKQHSISLHL